MNDKLCIHYALYYYAVPYFRRFCFPRDQSSHMEVYNASILIVLIFNI